MKRKRRERGEYVFANNKNDNIADARNKIKQFNE